MALLTILKFPHPILREKAAPVTEFGPELAQLAADMADTMYAAPGVGLAANQVGVTRQILVYDPQPDPEIRAYQVLLNPRIVAAEGEDYGEEGCLSVREYCAEVKRAWKIVVEAQDLSGQPLVISAEDFPARVLQHEIDHLHGVLFIDRISALKRALYKKKLKKLLQTEKEGPEEAQGDHGQ
ncbi:MAG: peptide deformylase [Desulfobulbaceae bacterium]|nr:peptide deformylase [Desulfobulbaceae bacterium]